MSDLEETLKQAIQMEVLKMVKSTPEYIEELVKAAVSGDVNQWGTPYETNSRRGEKPIPYLQFVVQNQIRGIAEEVVKEWLQGHRESIQDLIRNRISDTGVIDALAKAFVGSVSDDWRIEVRFNKHD